MKSALIMAEGIIQIMLVGETEAERATLRLVTPDKEISVDVKTGTLFDDHSIPNSALGYLAFQSQAGYVRTREQTDAVMLVLRPKPSSQSAAGAE